MPYYANAVKVMIASPGDVSAERRMFRDVIDEWNVINSRKEGIVLLPVGWETHAAPGMGDRPQAMINREVLADCDFLVAVFSTRLGSPTGVAESGTVEEIEEHLGGGKQAMLYFSAAPIQRAGFDLDQYAAVERVRAAYQGRGIVGSYTSIEDFRSKLTRDLMIRIAEHFTGFSADVGAAVESLRRFQENTPDLSPEAIEILKAATEDPENGSIMVTEFAEGYCIQIGQRALVDCAFGFKKAKWEAALQSLVDQGLIVAHGYRGQFYEPTLQGYEIAKSL